MVPSRAGRSGRGDVGEQGAGSVVCVVSSELQLHEHALARLVWLAGWRMGFGSARFRGWLLQLRRGSGRRKSGHPCQPCQSRECRSNTRRSSSKTCGAVGSARRVRTTDTVPLGSNRADPIWHPAATICTDADLAHLGHADTASKEVFDEHSCHADPGVHVTWKGRASFSTRSAGPLSTWLLESDPQPQNEEQ